MSNLKLSKILSWILHPILLPFVFTVLILSGAYYFNSMLRPEAYRIILLAVLIFTLALPVLIFTAARYLHIIASFEMKSRHERIFAISITGMVAWFSWSILRNFQLPPYYTDFLLVMFVGALLALIFTFFHKFSLHVYGWSMVAFTMVWYMIAWNSFNLFFLPLMIFMTGVVAWARLEEEAHSLTEVYLGFGLGVLPVGFLLVL